MHNPVMDANGHTFERSAIERSLLNRPGICPLTNERYPNGKARLTPNRAVRSMIDAFKEAAGEAASCALAIIVAVQHDREQSKCDIRL
jgi:hypothetical protein